MCTSHFTREPDKRGQDLATDWATRDRGKIIFPAPKCPDRLWAAPSLLFNEYRGSSQGKSVRGVKLTTDFDLVPWLRMNGAVPPLPSMPSWCRQGLLYLSHNVPHVLQRGADKSLVGPGRKQATATEDFEFHIPYL